MRPRNRRLASFCLLTGLALAMVGQFYFARRHDFLWDGAFLYGAACALFLAAVRLATSPSLSPHVSKPRWRTLLDWARGHPGRALMLVTSLALTIMVGARAEGSVTAAEGWALLRLWAAGVLLYLATVTDVRAAWAWLRDLVARRHEWQRELLLVLGLSAVAAGARLVSLEHIPFILGGDEASMGLYAAAVLEGRVGNPFGTGWLSHPTLFFYIQAIPVSWLGRTAVALRLVPALAGTLTVPALYLLVRELFDRRVALVSAAYLAVFHFAVHYSRLGYNNSVDPLLAVLGAYSLFLGLRSRRPECFALAGALVGLDQYFYMGSRVIPLMLGGLLAWLAWRERGFWHTYRSGILVLAGAFLVTAWPLLLFFARHPADFGARITQLGIIQSGWLARTAQELNRSQLSLLWQQFVRSALAFHVYPDRTSHYGPGIPLLDYVSAVPFTFGLAYTMSRLRERRHMLLGLWFWAVVILGGVLLENPPSSQRLVLTAVPVSVFIALALTAGLDVAERAFGWPRSTTWLGVGVALGLLASINLRFYFGTYTPSHVYGGINTEVGQEMGLYLRSLGQGYRYYFYGPPRMYAGFPTTAYLAPLVEGINVEEPASGPPEVASDRRPLFVFLPERLAELEPIESAFPGGRLREFRRPSGQLLFAVYEPDEVAHDAHE